RQPPPGAALVAPVRCAAARSLIPPPGELPIRLAGGRVGPKAKLPTPPAGKGLGTGVIGLIPSYQSIGLSAAILLFALRMIQGLCLGGEYGGAITYVAEHVSDERRVYYTGWLQPSPTLGIVLSLAVIVGQRAYA